MTVQQFVGTGCQELCTVSLWDPVVHSFILTSPPARFRCETVVGMNVSELLVVQHGVISRAQVLEAGERDRDIKRRLARREWSRLHPGVYIHHTGPPTWDQLVWGALLFY